EPAIYHTLLEGQIGLMPESLMGELQKHLYNGEYVLFKRAPVFESDFIQITKKGEMVNIHHKVTIVTIGLTSTSPNLQLPDVMLLARPSEQKKTWKLRSHQSSALSSDMVGPASARYSWSTAPSQAHSWATESAPSHLSPPGTSFMEPSFTTKHHLELTGLLPLKLVKITIFHKQKHRLQINLTSGRIFYLQLYVHPDCEHKVFDQWVKLVDLLRQAADSPLTPAEVTLPPSGCSTPQQQAHCRTSEQFQRDTESRERELWECETWKDPEESKIGSVVAERSLWRGSGSSQQDQERLISRQGSLTQLPVKISCRYSPTDDRPAFTTHINSRVFYVE
uniref:Golgi-associated RAB2 interactor protein 6-like n=1 Tax=Pristiophorus japonicus TaxID=55135 RepID=UPI00398E5780